jgi:hypothetical protein
VIGNGFKGFRFRQRDQFAASTCRPSDSFRHDASSAGAFNAFDRTRAIYNRSECDAVDALKPWLLAGVAAVVEP